MFSGVEVLKGFIVMQLQLVMTILFTVLHQMSQRNSHICVLMVAS